MDSAGTACGGGGAAAHSERGCGRATQIHGDPGPATVALAAHTDAQVHGATLTSPAPRPCSDDRHGTSTNATHRDGNSFEPVTFDAWTVDGVHGPCYAQN